MKSLHWPAHPASTTAPTAARRSVPAAILPWTAQIIVAAILVQTLYFKFTYAPETQVIFESRGGRPVATLLGIIELGCAILLLIPRRAALGAVVSLAIISGAILTHLTSLGIEVKNPQTGEGDGGLLFGMALVVALGSLVVLWFRREQLPFLGRMGMKLGLVRT